MILCALYFQVNDSAKQHLKIVSSERSLYREVCRSSRQTLKNMFTSEGLYLSVIKPRSTTDLTWHNRYDNYKLLLLIYFQTSGPLSQ